MEFKKDRVTRIGSAIGNVFFVLLLLNFIWTQVK